MLINQAKTALTRARKIARSTIRPTSVVSSMLESISVAPKTCSDANRNSSPVVHDNTIIMRAAKTGAASNSAISGIRFVQSPCAFSFAFAADFELKPSQFTTTPDEIIPKRVWKVETHSATNSTSAAMMPHTVLTISVQPPERAHHSRSSSSVKRPLNPTKSVAAKRNSDKKTGIANAP